jgi:hypothetical protein
MHHESIASKWDERDEKKYVICLNLYPEYPEHHCKNISPSTPLENRENHRVRPEWR